MFNQFLAKEPGVVQLIGLALFDIVFIYYCVKNFHVLVDKTPEIKNQKPKTLPITTPLAEPAKTMTPELATSAPVVSVAAKQPEAKIVEKTEAPTPPPVVVATTVAKTPEKPKAKAEKAPRQSTLNFNSLSAKTITVTLLVLCPTITYITWHLSKSATPSATTTNALQIGSDKILKINGTEVKTPEEAQVATQRAVLGNPSAEKHLELQVKDKDGNVKTQKIDFIEIRGKQESSEDTK